MSGIGIAESRSLVIRSLTDPLSLEQLSDNQWDLILRMLRRARLLGKLEFQIEKHGLQSKIPTKALNQLISARKVAASRKRMAFWEINRLQWALKGINADIVVLKGCGYLLKNLPVSGGRVFSDVDIMVSREDIASVEQVLKGKGWKAVELDDYDEHFYREWMHEVPPLRHPDRGIEVDLHHNILPLTSAVKANASRLLESSIELEDCAFKVLGPCEMILHSASHLFYGAELNRDLRGLIDLGDLLTDFAGSRINFWDELELAAKRTGLQRPLFYAVHFCVQLLNINVPKTVLQRYRNYGPGRFTLYLMDKLVPLSIFPDHPEIPSMKSEICRWCLYVRSHYVKMPLAILIPHLIRKFLKRRRWNNSPNEIAMK